MLVVAMGAVLHQYRPVAANRGGAVVSRFTPLHHCWHHESPQCIFAFTYKPTRKVRHDRLRP